MTEPEHDRHHAGAATRVGAGTAISSIAWVLGRALTLATLILLIRALPADDLGALLAAIAAGLLGAAVATGGLPDATARSAAWDRPAVDDGFGTGDLRNALTRFGLTLPFVFVLLALLSDTPDGMDWQLLVAGALLAATQGATSILAAVFRARGQAVRFALATGLAVAVGRTVVAVLALVLDAGLPFVLWTFVILNGAVIAVTWTAATRNLRPGRSTARAPARSSSAAPSGRCSRTSTSSWWASSWARTPPVSTERHCGWPTSATSSWWPSRCSICPKP